MKLANTQNGIITKEDVCKLLQITPNQAYKVIKNSRARGVWSCCAAADILDTRGYSKTIRTT